MHCVYVAQCFAVAHHCGAGSVGWMGQVAVGDTPLDGADNQRLLNAHFCRSRASPAAALCALALLNLLSGYSVYFPRPSSMDARHLRQLAFGMHQGNHSRKILQRDLVAAAAVKAVSMSVCVSQAGTDVKWQMVGWQGQQRKQPLSTRPNLGFRGTECAGGLEDTPML